MQKFSFQRQVLTGFSVTLLVVFFLAIVSYTSVKDLENSEEAVNHTEQVIQATEKIRALLTEAESSERGYLITDMPHFLDRYTFSINQIETSIHQLKELLDGNPEQLRNLDTLSHYAVLKISYMKRLIATYDSKGLSAAITEVKTSQGKFYMDQVYASLTKIENHENKLLKLRRESNTKSVNRTLIISLSGAFIIFCLLLVLFNYIKRTFNLQKQAEEEVRRSHTQLETITKQSERQHWLLEGAVNIDAAMRGAQTTEERCQTLIVAISKILKADLGVLYVAEQSEKLLTVKGSYGFPMEGAKKNIKAEDGLIGQAIIQKQGVLFQNIPHDYVKVSSGLGNSTAKAIFVQPVYNNDKLKAIIEVAYIAEANPDTAEFLNNVVYSIGVALAASEARVEMLKLFEQTQQQAEELESQHEELRTTNEELTRKTQQLQASEEELMVQQEELRQANSELEEKAELLEERNKAIEEANRAIQIKAEEVEQTSKYKSEFLANMSHELRTPLNSILILAKILRENKQKTLSEEQIKYAGVIHTAGSDLLSLINDILDLSKIESGKVDLTLEDVSVREMKVDAELLFNEVAKTKKVNFAYNIAEGAPLQIYSDRQRIEQVVKNLLSNAFKFTPENGYVTVDVARAEGIEFNNENLKSAEAVIAFNVKDTGIGIPYDKQKAIFEAFQQADGSTSRKYGGTGLGLSISRELANLLKGEIRLVSEPGKGSTFTLYLPATLADTAKESTPAPAPTASVAASTPVIQPAAVAVAAPVSDAKAGKAKLPETEKEYTLLIIEDDPNFAEILKDYAIERGFKPIVANQGDTGLEMAHSQKPDAIVLDIMLPVMDGWSVLKKLKEDPETYKIPVHMMSAKDEANSKARMEGAIGFLKKPVDKDQLDHAFDILIEDSGKVKINRVLLVEDQRIQSDALTNQLLSKQVDVKQAFDGEETMRILHEDQNFDCIILDLKLPDISGLDLLEKIKGFEKLVKIPVVINTAMELDQESMSRVMKYTHAMVLKSNKSNDRLLDEVNLFMNKIRTSQANGSENQAAAPAPKISNTVTIEGALKNKSVLIVDDDMRNIFALTSALQEYDFEIEIANNGHEALKKLDAKPNTDIVLMDIMMPEMDGYEAMGHIRKQNRFNKLPIIALTAKAMKNDREKCIEAGANDYISKPVEIDKLISMMRVWLS